MSGGVNVVQRWRKDEGGMRRHEVSMQLVRQGSTVKIVEPAGVCFPSRCSGQLTLSGPQAHAQQQKSNNWTAVHIAFRLLIVLIYFRDVAELSAISERSSSSSTSLSLVFFTFSFLRGE